MRSMTEHNSGTDGGAAEDYPLDDPALSMRYRQAAVEMPPGHLDKAILSASRKAVRPRSRLAFSPFASDWHVPVSLAAVLVSKLQ